MKNGDPIVYLLKIVNDDKTLYKIGYTSGSVFDRVKSLQTGCPYKIEVADTYKSDYGRLIEKTLHGMFSHKQTHGEWFELNVTDEFNFRSMCEKYEKIQIDIDEYKRQ